MTVDRTPRRTPRDGETFDTVTYERDVIEVDVRAGASIFSGDHTVWVETTAANDTTEGYVASLDAQDLDDLIANLTAARVRLRELTA